MLTFVLEVEGSLTDKKSSDQYLRADVLYFHAVIEVNVMREDTVSTCVVQAN